MTGLFSRIPNWKEASMPWVLG